MPNETLTPEKLEKIRKQISSDQQLLEQWEPELLDTIQEQENQKRKMYEQSQQTTNTKDLKIIDLIEQKTIATHSRIALINEKIKLFTPHEQKNAIVRYARNLTFINDLTKITHDLNLQDQLQNILEITRTRTFPSKTKPMPNTTLTRKDLQKIDEEICNDLDILEQLVPEILPTILKNQEQEMCAQSKETTNTNDRKMMDLIEQVTTPPFALCDNELIFFTPDKIKNVIYKYKKNVTKINDLKKVTDDPGILNHLTDILQFSARAIPPDSD